MCLEGRVSPGGRLDTRVTPPRASAVSAGFPQLLVSFMLAPVLGAHKQPLPRGPFLDP